MLQVRTALLVARRFVPGSAAVGIDEIELAALENSGVCGDCMALLRGGRAAVAASLSEVESEHEMELRHAVEVRQAAVGKLVLAGPYPSADLIREIAGVLPEFHIDWLISTPNLSLPEMPHDKAA
jgi:hypothetical protein